MASTPNAYVSHDSALFYWRTNPWHVVLEGLDQNIRALKCCPANTQEALSLNLPEVEFGPAPIDVLLPMGASRYGSSRLRFHAQKAKLPPHSLCPLHDGVHVVSPELCLLQMCDTKPFLEALEIGLEFCGTYALRPSGVEEKANRNYRLIDAEAFRRHVASWKGLHGLRKARSVSQYLANGSNSPMETKLYMLLRLPQKYGGYNLPIPELNPEIPLDVAGREALRQTNVSPDMLWRSAHTVVEYDGEYHNDPRQAVKDELRRSILESMGYTVFVFKKQHVYNLIVFDVMVRALADKLGKRIRTLTDKQAYARDALRDHLLG